MARMRTIKPEAFTSEVLTACSIPARWTFAGLWTYCDDDGRGRADPRLIKAAIWPLDDDVTAKDVAAHLDELEARRLICRYQAQGKQYVHVVNFSEHQKPNRPVPSKLPACSRRTHGGLSEDALTHHDGRTRIVSNPSGDARDAEQGIVTAEDAAEGGGEREMPGQSSFTEDSVRPHGDVKTNSFTNTPSPSPTATTDGDGDGDGDVGGDGEDITPANPLRDDVERLCAHLADRIEANGSNRPAIGKKWRDAARLMIDRDGRPEDRIHAAIDWCQDSEFWRTNILSMPKLREQYEQLRLQAKRAPGSARPPVRQINYTDEEYHSGW